MEGENRDSMLGSDSARSGAVRPILLLASPGPSLPPGAHPVPGAKAPRGASAASALVLASLAPLNPGHPAYAEREAMAGVLPAPGFVPNRYDVPAWDDIEGERCAIIRGSVYHAAALAFVADWWRGVRWLRAPVPGALSVPRGGEVLHGWHRGVCVAAVCRMEDV